LPTKGNQGQNAPEDALEMALEFGRQVQEKAKELGVVEIWNGDQTPVQFEMIPRKTVDVWGSKTVWVRCAGEDKERVSVMLLASSLGRKKKPSIVFKQITPTTAEASQENGSRVWANFKDAVGASGCQVHANAKAWFTGPIIANWLRFNFSFNTEPILLLLDEFTGHRTPEVLETAKQLNITIMSIPPGLTSTAQPADISWNKPFKGFLRRKWTKKLMEDMMTMDDFKGTEPSRDQLLNWITEAWEFLSEDTIVSGFQRANMISAAPSDHVEQSVEIPDSVTQILVEALECLNVE